jgi:hypothetical protein
MPHLRRFGGTRIERTVYQEQVGSDDQAASEAGRVGEDAGGFSIGQSEAGYQDEAAFDGAFLRQRDTLWI